MLGGKKQKKQKSEKLSNKAKALIQKRSSMISSATKWNERHKVEYAELNKAVKRQVREDVRKHNAKLPTEIIQQINSTNKADRILNIWKNKIIAIKRPDGSLCRDRREIL